MSIAADPAMGFYIRKSISVGPVRFDLSQSGIDLSTGIKGFRIGSGPSGGTIFTWGVAGSISAPPCRD